jgi:gentisate 1,2-dioxygenase
MASVPQPKTDLAARQAFYRRMDKDNLAPLWETLANLIPDEPVTEAKPGFWKYRQIRPFITEAGNLITAREAIRRVLVLENPGMRGKTTITQSLYCGLQLILPGEIAPSHRHSQSALRLIVEGSGAYTAVDGERTVMHPGDFIITPSWTWHDHGNPGSEPVVWMDGLDVNIVQLFAAQFHEVYPEEVQPVTRAENTMNNRFGNNLAPLEPVSPFGKTSPLFNYPYERTREVLGRLAREGEPDACHGWKMRFTNPLTGGWAMPTIGTMVQLLPKGFRSAPYRSTDGMVWSVIEGEGRVSLGGTWHDFEPRDTFVAPSWVPVLLEANDEVVLFSYSDRPAQEALGLFREKRG